MKCKADSREALAHVQVILTETLQMQRTGAQARLPRAVRGDVRARARTRRRTARRRARRLQLGHQDLVQ
eukprot:1327575-Pleurochrysis_carterae.AAC.2